MTIELYCGIVVAASVLMAYTMRFQGATLAWGKALAPDNPLLPTGMQDAITPTAQTARNTIMFLSWPAVLAMGFVFFEWYLAVGGLLAVWLGSVVIGGVFLPQSTSTFFARRILSSLMAREKAYAAAGDEVRLNAIGPIIERLQLLVDLS